MSGFHVIFKFWRSKSVSESKFRITQSLRFAMRMENIDQSLDSNQNHCEPTVNLPKPGAVRYHSATLILVGAKFEHIFIHPTLALFFLFINIIFNLTWFG